MSNTYNPEKPHEDHQRLHPLASEVFEKSVLPSYRQGIDNAARTVNERIMALDAAAELAGAQAMDRQAELSVQRTADAVVDRVEAARAAAIDALSRANLDLAA